MTDSFKHYPRLGPVMGSVVPTFGDAAGGATNVSPETSSSTPPSEVTPASATDPGTHRELAVAAGTAVISGATVGGIAAGTWRGAAIGAALNAALWAGLTASGSWGSIDRTTKTVLGVSAAVGVVGTGLLIWTRDRG